MLIGRIYTLPVGEEARRRQEINLSHSSEKDFPEIRGIISDAVFYMWCKHGSGTGSGSGAGHGAGRNGGKMASKLKEQPAHALSLIINMFFVRLVLGFGPMLMSKAA